MSVKQVNLRNLQRKLCKRIRASFAKDSWKCQNQKLKRARLVFERATKLYNYSETLIILLKVNIEAKCV